MPTEMDDEAGAVDGDAALEADDADAADAADVMPTVDGVAQPGEIAADTEVAVAAAAVPGRGGSARVRSIQSDSPKGVTQKRCDMRETAVFVRFSDPPPGPSVYQRGDWHRRRFSTHSNVVTSRSAAVRSSFPGAPPRGGRVRSAAILLFLTGYSGPLVDRGGAAAGARVGASSSTAQEGRRDATGGLHHGIARARRAPREAPRRAGRPGSGQRALGGTADVFVHGRGFSPRA